MTVQELSAALGYSCAGETDREVTGLCWPDSAERGQVAVCSSKESVHRTGAEVVLTDQFVVDTNKTILYAYEPCGLAMVRALRVLMEHGLCADYAQPCSLTLSNNGFACGSDVSIGKGTVISPFCTVENGVCIGKGCTIESGAVLKRDTQIGDHVRIGAGTVVGADAFYHYAEGGELEAFVGVARAVIGNDVSIGSSCVIQRGVLRDTVVGSHTQIGNLVDVGHDVLIGANCKIVSQCGFAGNAEVGDRVQIFGQVGVANGVKIGAGAVVMAQSAVTRDVPAGQMVSGMYAREHTKELRTIAKVRRL